MSALNPLLDPEGHRWVTPEELTPQKACPDCACCTDRLCRKAAGVHLGCGIVAGPRDFSLVKDCPCGQAAQAAGLERAKEWGAQRRATLAAAAGGELR